MRVVFITPFTTYIKLKQYNVKKSWSGDKRFFVSETSTLALANSIELDFSPVERSESVQQELDQFLGSVQGEREKDVHNEEEGADNPCSNTKRAKEPSKSGLYVHSGKGKVESRSQGDLEL